MPTSAEHHALARYHLAEAVRQQALSCWATAHEAGDLGRASAALEIYALAEVGGPDPWRALVELVGELEMLSR